MQIINKKGRFKYNIGETLEVGMSLSGNEVKTVKISGADLSNAYCKIIGREMYLINVNIPVSESENPFRTRKLLLHRDQIVELDIKTKKQNLTLIPLKMYTRGRLLKLEIGLAKGKKTYEKKESIKRRDIEREAEEELKDRNR